MQGVKRAYQSPKRTKQAAATRNEILVSARGLFIKEGYGGATIDAIARGAGVAPQTVYATYGSKRAILFALLDQMAIDADAALLEENLIAAAGDPRRQLRDRVAFNVRFYAKGSELIEVARAASRFEPDLAAMWREGESRRYRGQGALLKEWARRGSLARDLTVHQATDVMWALTGPDVYRLFVVERGWSHAQLQRWLVSTLEPLLLGRARPESR